MLTAFSSRMASCRVGDPHRIRRGPSPFYPSETAPHSPPRSPPGPQYCACRGPCTTSAKRRREGAAGRAAQHSRRTQGAQPEGQGSKSRIQSASNRLHHGGPARVATTPKVRSLAGLAWPWRPRGRQLAGGQVHILAVYHFSTYHYNLKGPSPPSDGSTASILETSSVPVPCSSRSSNSETRNSA
jgi:hypothetical protein